MARIGTGSLGGKARGLAFVNRLLLDADVASRFPGIQITVPSSVVLGTDVFDRFMRGNRLDYFALSSTSEEEIRGRFAAAPFPETVLRDLRVFLQSSSHPLAVRSSGLLEDSPSQPLAGVYRTVMVANRGSLRQRLADLVAAVKHVYASTFSPQAKAFLKMTQFGLQEAEADGTLVALGSTYSPENNTITDGIGRPGVRLVSFVPIPSTRCSRGRSSSTRSLRSAAREPGPRWRSNSP